MTIALRTLDDGAWISVNDSRQVSVSDVWTLSRGVFCDCEPAYVLLEGFTDVGVDGSIVTADAVGQCLECGTRDSIDRLSIGRVIDGEFEPYDPESVQSLVEPDAETGADASDKDVRDR
ncbi:hypothetical protein Htur_2856 [Haloterrigena turkmenica DSM 5511]|uniref:DUF8134 domain-containing protein n=1 Tax=Haloterrigena turkmenica (strain ATCC 51198 / DSM 5511 / JCM 9101 / NCIMB 13204 / VKM B-1734 / 4k) TaxID=543526 RepID=D2RXK1_HALTV|nr:hypothetical protein [Haloterrigena turkmenica]ADB61725.1 hypothetical protein Htur_2856 [Haloterrigena turkmenica DSM 5511]